MKINFSRGVGGSLSHLWKFRRGGGSSVAKMENPGRWWGPKWNSLRGGGLDIFWNYTIHTNKLKFKELRKMTKKLIHSSYLQYNFTEDEAITCNSRKMKNHCYCAAQRGIRTSARWQSRKIHKNTRSTAQFGRNLTEYMSVQHIWNLSGDVFCHKLANLSWNFVTETRKRPSTQCS